MQIYRAGMRQWGRGVGNCILCLGFPSGAICDHFDLFSRFLNPPLQLHMYAMPRVVGRRGQLRRSQK